MKKNQLIFLFLLISFVFVSFHILSPIKKKIPLSQEYYSLDIKDMNIHNRPPIFKNTKKGIFSISPSKNHKAKGSFLFKENKKYIFYFAIVKGTDSAKILFTMKKNGIEFKKFLLNREKDVKLDIRVNQNDKITIIADSNDTIDGSYANLEILNYEPKYILKLRLAELLWIVFFIYLVSKGYSYIALNTYIGFLLSILAEKMNFGTLPYFDLTAYMALYFLFAFIFMLIYQELRILKKLKIATILTWITTIVIYTIPISFIVYYLIFNKPIDWNILFAIYQTNPSEAVGFIESFVSTPYLIAIAIFLLLLGYLYLHQELKSRQPIERSLLIFIIITLVGFLATNFLKMRIPKLIETTYQEYNNQIECLKEFQKKRKTDKIKFSAIKKEKGETYVIVIGESLFKYNMGIYGHFRDTTPKQKQQVKKDNLQVFNNVYANAGNTMRSLSFMLTEANQYNGKDFLQSLSFIDIFNKAGFDTTWLSTQGVLGETNTIVSVIAQSSNHVVDLINNVGVKTGVLSTYDENTIIELKKRVSQNNDENRLIIIHLYGNHFRYGDRHPESYTKYKFDDTKPYMVGINLEYILKDYSEYDNSVLYNDYVVSSLLDVLKSQGGVSVFMYLSDHGEDIIRHRGHTARLDGFTYPMIQIPMTAWLSPEYIKRYPKTYKTFISHKNSLFSNDMIYDTIIGLAHIKTDRHDSKYDLSSSSYKLEEQEALTLHGRRKYATSKNYYFWRKHNTKLLQDNNLTNKVVIRDTDTVGKLNEAWILGYRMFELDINYTQNKKSFKVGRKKYDTKGNLLNLLSFFKSDKIKKLFLHIPNLNQSNIDSAISRLNNVDSKLNLKEKIVILTDNNFIQKFKDKGFKVALIGNNNSKNSELADYLIFDIKNYSNIKYNNSFKNIIIDHIFNVADSKLQDKLNSIKNINSNKLNFIFADFKSEFDE